MAACAVFGGTKGIGAAVSRLLYQRGHNVAALSRSQDNVSTFLQTVPKQNSDPDAPQLLGLACDVTKEEDITKSFSEITQRLGPVKILVNAAGVTQNQLLLKTSVTDIHHFLNTNLVGSMLTCKVALRSMMQHREGCIINIGSIVGSKGNAGQCAYSASKAGLEGFTKSLAKEVAGRGIRVNCINPGFIDTEMTAGLRVDQLQRQIPTGRLGEAEEVADLVYFLVNASYITGQTVFIDGGLHINS